MLHRIKNLAVSEMASRIRNDHLFQFRQAELEMFQFRLYELENGI
jgi:hypothetical protein